MIERLETIEKKYNDITEELMNPDVLSDINKTLKLNKELSDLKESYDAYQLLKKIDKLKSINSYGNDYIELKKEILLNKDYSRYLELEKKLFFDIKDINNKLNCLLEKSGCI